MASLINPTNIDVTYPIAGQDNDTQGFRDNFSSIKNNLNVAKNEITAIQEMLNSSAVITTVPVSASATGTTGEIAIDSNWLYACIATNTWVRAPVSTWSGPFYITGVASVSGNLIANSGTTSTSTTTGALIVNGGVGISGNVNIGGNVSANTLTVTSAIQFANLTTAQISTISTPARGMTVYNYNLGNIQVYNGTKWANITLS